MKVLIVDDNEGIVCVLKEILLSLLPDSQIKVAGNGKTGLDILRSENIDLLFSDVDMPIKSGIDMISDANQSGAAPKNIIIMTAADPEWFKRNELFLEALGIKGFLRKPFPIEHLIDILEQL